MLVEGAATTLADAASLGSRIRSAATTLLHLVDGVLESPRLESGTVRIDARPLEVAAFLRRSRATGVDHAASRSGASLAIVAGPRRRHRRGEARDALVEPRDERAQVHACRGDRGERPRGRLAGRGE